MTLSAYVRLEFSYPRGDLFGPSPILHIFRFLDIKIDLIDLIKYSREVWLPKHGKQYSEEKLLSDYLTQSPSIMPSKYWLLDKSLAQEAIEPYGIDPIFAERLAEKELPLRQIYVLDKYDWNSWVKRQPIPNDIDSLNKELSRFLSE